VKSGAADKTAPAFAIDKATKAAAKDATENFNSHPIRVEAVEFMRATNNNTGGAASVKKGTFLVQPRTTAQATIRRSQTATATAL